MYDTSVLQRELTPAEYDDLRHRRANREFGPTVGNLPGVALAAISAFAGIGGAIITRMLINDLGWTSWTPSFLPEGWMPAFWPERWPPSLVLLAVAIGIFTWVVLRRSDRRESRRQPRIAAFALANGLSYEVSGIRRVRGVLFEQYGPNLVNHTVSSTDGRLAESGRYSWVEPNSSSTEDGRGRDVEHTWYYVAWRLPAGSPKILLLRRRGSDLTKSFDKFRRFKKEDRVTLGPPLDGTYRAYTLGKSGRDSKAEFFDPRFRQLVANVVPPHFDIEFSDGQLLIFTKRKLPFDQAETWQLIGRIEDQLVNPLWEAAAGQNWPSVPGATLP